MGVTERARIWNTVPPNTRQRVTIPVEGSQYEAGEPVTIRAVVLNGALPGPNMLVCAGIHGDEYEGPRALQQLSQEINLTDLRGCLVFVPVVNEAAVASGTRCHPEDGKNLARVFPGNAHGTISEQIAFTFVHQLLKGADFFIDLHSANSQFRIDPWAGYQVRTGKVQELQRRMAIAFGLDTVWGSAVLPGRTLTAAGDLGIPSIYVEMPGEGRCRPEDVETNRRGVLQTLASVGMMDGDFPRESPTLLVESTTDGTGELSIRQKVSTAGVFHPEATLGDFVFAGDLIGTVVDPWGDVQCEVLAEVSGRLVYVRTFPTVVAGDSVATIIETDMGCQDGG